VRGKGGCEVWGGAVFEGGAAGGGGDGGVKDYIRPDRQGFLTLERRAGPARPPEDKTLTRFWLGEATLFPQTA
jgi:hypothetical protein